jgi:hypothetical protein
MVMTLNTQTITKGFIVAGLMNISVLIFSRFFTNPVIAEYDPALMSNFGLLMIVIWGLAYIAVAKSYFTVKWLVGVFALEKLIYGFIWIRWIMTSNLSEVYGKDVMAGIFYSVYGINDWIFFFFFLLVFIRLHKIGSHS